LAGTPIFVDLMSRILFVENKVPYVLSHRLPLLRAAQRAGHEVCVATLIAGDGSLIEQHGFTYYPIGSDQRSNNPLAELRLIARLVQLYRRVEPDLIHHITLRCVLYGSIAARFQRGAAIVNGVTGLGYLFSSEDTKVQLLRRAVLSVLYLVTRGMQPWWIFQNPDDKQLFAQWGIIDAARARVILGSGVDMDRFRAASNGSGYHDTDATPVAIFPARMLWSKGAGVFVEAAQLLEAKNTPVRMALVGDTDPDNPEAIPSATLQAWDDEGVVEWWGYQDDMPAVFKQSDIVCLPSMYREGVPKVLIEAASCSRPIVTTDAPGCREIVRDGWNGYLVPVGNPKAVAEALAALAADPHQRTEMGRKGRRLVDDQFSIDHVVRSTLDLYNDALA
jgi:glycosyltransferase involved in cell wall biosynthesis